MLLKAVYCAVPGYPGPQNTGRGEAGPNFYITPFAAVFFADEPGCPAQYALNRPWVDQGCSQPWAAGGRRRFLEHQLHPAAPETFEVLALEFVARVVPGPGLCRLAGAPQAFTGEPKRDV